MNTQRLNEVINKYKSGRELESCISEIINHFYGFTPYPEQLKAGFALAKGRIVNQNTGEGKTISVLIAALVKLLDNKKLFIISSNDYLVKRDYDYALDLLRELGYNPGYINSQGSALSYESFNPVYITGETLIFDYLRGIPAQYDFAIIDEIDYLLVECAGQDFSVSDGSSEVKMPPGIFFAASDLADSFEVRIVTAASKKEDVLFDYNYEADYIVDMPKQSVSITEAGYRRVYELFGCIDLMFIEALTATLLVRHFYIRGSEYIVRNGKIVIISRSNGRIMENGSNDLMIQTAIEVKEGLEITNKAVLTSTCSFPVFFTVFKDFSGISGTASYVPFDFSNIYGKDVVKIPDHFKNQRKTIYKYFEKDEERLTFTKIVLEGKGPFLIITNSDKRSFEVYEKLKGVKDTYILDNYVLDKEKELLLKLTKEETVLISSRIVGRGTDISLPKELENGLTVILINRFSSERTERQAIGRCARNGKAGTCFILSSPEDQVFSLSKTGDAIKSERQVKALQKQYEARQYEVRRHIFIRSKLWFDLDKGILERINNINLPELKTLAKNCDVPERIYLEGLEDIPVYIKSLSKEIYTRLRPVLQMQFITYNDLNSQALYSDHDFYFRTKEYVKMGKDAIVTCYGKAAELANRKGIRDRKKEIHKKAEND